jgi:4-hydroxymandelate synthase
VLPDDLVWEDFASQARSVTCANPKEPENLLMINEAARLTRLDHVVFYVADLDARIEEMVTKLGFSIVATGDPAEGDHKTVALQQAHIVLVLTQGLSDEHPATGYVDAHGDGVADIVLGTSDVHAAFESMVAAGARTSAAPGAICGTVTAAIHAFGDVRHTLVQRSAGAGGSALPPGLVAVEGKTPSASTGLREVDHIAVCVESGELGPTVDFYESVLGFNQIFEEKVVVGAQAMNSTAIRSASKDVTFTILEPDTSRAPGQIDAFIENHGNAGVQHLAFSTDDIVKSVRAQRRNGVDFLTAPASYYELLAGRMDLISHTVSELAKLNVLADADHAGQLYQIFTRSTHPRETYFTEIVERLGAETFGSGNVKALYEAIELERRGRGGEALPSPESQTPATRTAAR